MKKRFVIPAEAGIQASPRKWAQGFPGRSLVLAAFVAFAGPLDLLTRFARRLSLRGNDKEKRTGLMSYPIGRA